MVIFGYLLYLLVYLLYVLCIYLSKASILSLESLVGFVPNVLLKPFVFTRSHNTPYFASLYVTKVCVAFDPTHPSLLCESPSSPMFFFWLGLHFLLAASVLHTYPSDKIHASNSRLLVAKILCFCYFRAFQT